MTDTQPSTGPGQSAKSSVSAFLRTYALRGSQITWFLGAGASAAAGIPTAEQMIWEFKRELYTSQQRRSPKLVEDLASPRVRAFLQSFFDGAKTFPAVGAPDEYAHYFELCYPSEADRRTFIDARVRGGRPSFGHTALGSLIANGLCEVVWTTNFDRTVEDAVALALGTTTTLRTVDVDAPHLANQVLSERAFPLLVKLHGDFHSRALKNTTEELRAQDAQLRRVLVDELRRRGVAFVGYSGRDDSVMTALEEVASERGGFPGGLFWFYRADSPPSKRVTDLLDSVTSNGGEAAAIAIGTFDELLGDILRHLGKNTRDSSSRRKLTSAPIPETKGEYPALRLNALPIIRWPQTARCLVVRDIGGTREVREAITESGANVLAVRTHAGVVGFGSDREFDRMLRGRKTSHRDIHTIDAARLHADSSEMGLLLDALCSALGRERPLVVHRRGWRKFLLPSPGEHELHGKLRQAARAIEGAVPKTTLRWSEAAHVRLDYRLSRLWLILEPTVMVDETDDEGLRLARADFVRERLATRYNRMANDFIAAWVHIIAGGPTPTVISALGIADGVDAQFEISATTAFSWRAAQ